jgi:hypothetical protein
MAEATVTTANTATAYAPTVDGKGPPPHKSAPSSIMNMFRSASLKNAGPKNLALVNPEASRLSRFQKITQSLHEGFGSFNQDMSFRVNNTLDKLRKTSDIDGRAEALVKEWTILISQWQTVRDSERVDKLCFEGLPPSLRGQIWLLIIGNDLGIDEPLWAHFRNCAKQAIGLHQALEEQRNAWAMEKWQSSNDLTADPGVYPQASESSKSDRLERPARESKAEDSGDNRSGCVLTAEADRDRRLVETLEARFGCSQADTVRAGIVTIHVDIPRTFPQLQFFQEGPMRDSLLSVLAASATYSPYVGYVQGMSYIAAFFLLNMESDLEAFSALCNLLHQDLFLRFFQFNTAHMQLHCRAFDVLLAKRLPKVTRLFVAQGITPDLYLFEWLLTLFTRTLSLEASHRVWDNFLLRGTIFLFRTGLGIIRMLAPEFETFSFEKILNVLNRLPADLSTDTLFSHIKAIPLVQEDMDRAMEELEKESKGS